MPVAALVSPVNVSPTTAAESQLVAPSTTYTAWLGDGRPSNRSYPAILRYPPSSRHS